MFKVILYYKYVLVSDPKALAEQQRQLCLELGLKGRILIAEEGINGTLEGTTKAIAKYNQNFLSNPLFSDVNIKISEGTGDCFRKLSVKVRNEIVASHLHGKVDPLRRTGKYLEAEELHEWFETGKEFYIVDMRNDYETSAGKFQNSIPSGIGNFRFLPEILKTLRPLQDKTILTVCTGGVRCEKASAFLIENGFAEVYQLKDGIVTYMEKYPNEHFKGKLYVFDKRILIGFNTAHPSHEVVGMCHKCGITSEHFVNCSNDECHLHFICCENCFTDGNPYCSEKCFEIIRPQKFQIA